MTTIHCPHCNQAININDALAHDLTIEYEAKLATEKKQLEVKASEKLTNEKKQLELAINKQAEERYGLELQTLRQQNETRSKELQTLKAQELHLRKEKQRLEELQQSVELEVQRKLDEERKSIADKARLQEREQTLLQLKQKDQTLESLREQLEAMKRKAEQGSQQAQGEVQEIELEKLLHELFPLDIINEIQKGVNGADLIHTVNNKVGKPCGTISIESKRTKSFNEKWIEKLKEDMLRHGAELGVIVTETMPEGHTHIIQLERNIWVCPLAEFKGLALALRDSLLRVDAVKTVQGNSREKMKLLYDYLTSSEFKQQLEIIFGGFRALESNLAKEKRAMQKLWKEREKQLDKVYSNALDFYGSVSGIAGADIPTLEALELDNAQHELSLLEQETE